MLCAIWSNILVPYLAHDYFSIFFACKSRTNMPWEMGNEILWHLACQHVLLCAIWSNILVPYLAHDYFSIFFACKSRTNMPWEMGNEILWHLACQQVLGKWEKMSFKINHVGFYTGCSGAIINQPVKRPFVATLTEPTIASNFVRFFAVDSEAA